LPKKDKKNVIVISAKQKKTAYDFKNLLGIYFIFTIKQITNAKGRAKNQL